MKFLRNKLTVTISILSVGFLVLIGYSVNRENRSLIEGGVATIFNGTQKAIYNSTDEVRDFFYLILNFKEVKEEYETMNKRNAELEQEAANYEAVKKENDILKEQLNYKDRNSQFNYKGANIINRRGNGMIEEFTIDKGSRDDIVKGSVVITHEGLVGQITSVDVKYSIVQTFGNENMAVAAMVENSIENDGIVKGFKDRGNNLLAKMYSLPQDSTIKQGDVITTSDYGNIYPKGIRIGHVIAVEEDKAKVMKNALVQPFVDLKKLENILIIVPKDK